MATAPSAAQPTQPASTWDARALNVDRAARTHPVGSVTSPVGPGLERRPDYRYECGHRLSAPGVGQYRVYFELGLMGTDEPVMDRACPACARGLPGKNPR